MLSVIVSSYKQDDFERFSRNVEETIGIPYEIIKIDNPGKMGLAEAYNLGASKAQFELLGFLHDDITFETKNWGHNLLTSFDTLQNPGVIGIAGTILKTEVLSGWAQPNIGIELCRFNLNQYYKFKKKEFNLAYSNPEEERASKVITVDGVFMAVKKSIWEQNKFDEELIRHFHGYDLDFCLTIAKHHQNYVVFDILLNHYSEGNMSKEWVETYIALHKKQKKFLKRQEYDYPAAFINTINNYHLAGLFLLIKQLKIPFSEKFVIIRKVIFLHASKYFHPSFFSFLIRKLFKRMIKRSIK
jgi:glycosyltransferase involved in cell wall biosynthesis